MLELHAVTKHFAGLDGETIRAIDGVSLALARGELAALYGPSGSGKSTLLLLAAGIAQPDAGSVRFEGRDLSTLTRREHACHRREAVGFVFQSARLVPGLSAIDNAALKLMAEGASRPAARRRVAPLLERLGVLRRAEHRATQLSRGEAQRVSLARALSNDPHLILADEPTAALDSERGREVLRLLAEICRERGVGVLLATHDPAGTEIADRVHQLRDGRLATAAEQPAQPAAGTSRR